MSYLASAGRIETRDIDEHRQVIQPWELILRQMSPGPFRGWIEYVQVNGVLLYREHCTRRVLVTGSTPPGYFVFGSPSSPRTRIDWCGAKIDPGLLAFARASTEIDVVIPEPSDHVALLVPEALLLEYLGEELGQVVSARADRHLRCHTRLGEALVRAARQGERMRGRVVAGRCRRVRAAALAKGPAVPEPEKAVCKRIRHTVESFVGAVVLRWVERRCDRRTSGAQNRLSPLRESCRRGIDPRGITSANATL